MHLVPSQVFEVYPSPWGHLNNCLAAQTVNSGPPRTFTTPIPDLISPEFDESSTDISQNGSPAAGRDFRDIIERHRQLVADDDDGEDYARSPNMPIPKTPLVDLFDFTSDDWAKKYNHYTKIGYNDELELYDLLELDAEGEVDDLDSRWLNTRYFDKLTTLYFGFAMILVGFAISRQCYVIFATL